MSDNAEWRLGGQERYLTGVTLRWQEYHASRADWDHDHCAFCWKKFMERTTPNVEHAGYATADQKHWICRQCFDDLRDRFGWVVIQ